MRSDFNAGESKTLTSFGGKTLKSTELKSG
jgi:hypothetical protein